MADLSLFTKLYPSLSKTDIDKLETVPIYVRPIITLSDVRSRFIKRYFVRNFSSTSVIEVDKKQYNQFRSNPRYITVEINWKLVGKKETITQSNGIELLGVIDTNKITVSKADLTFGGLMNYIIDYAEFWVGES